MVISLVQNSPVKGDLTQNLSEIDQLLSNAEQGNFIFLPELFNTSYLLSTEDLEPDDYQKTIDWMARKAQAGRFFIAGSIPVMTGEKMYNRWLGIDEAGQMYTYDKTHLFVPGGEGRGYLAGTEVKLFNIQGIVVRPLICYDLRFPYVSFQDVDQPYDVLVYAANWPAPRIEQWKQLLKARAIENQAYVVGVNRVGVDHYGNVYPGASMVVDYMGRVLVEMDDQPGLASVSIDLEAMHRYRNKFPFLKDASPGLLGLPGKICRDKLQNRSSDVEEG
jgi:omega-amidase